MTAALRILRGDIFASPCKTLVNPVNLVGTSGAGLAFAFKQRFPISVAAYERDVKSGHSQLWLGRPADYEILERGKRVVFFATKQHWRNPSRIEWIRDGIGDLSANVCENPTYYESIAIPALGCGLGGLRWADVLPLIEHESHIMRAHGVSVEVYEP